MDSHTTQMTRNSSFSYVARKLNEGGRRALMTNRDEKSVGNGHRELLDNFQCRLLDGVRAICGFFGCS